MTPEILLTYVLACILVVIVPGPTVTVIIANSLRSGARAGLLNVAGTQAGLLVMLIVLAAGLEVIVSRLAFVFDWVRTIGALYLLWLGFRLLRAGGKLGAPVKASQAERSFFWQGVLVIWSNPKALFFFGAFIPQFITADGSAAFQTIILGLIFMIVATILDGCYAIAAGRAGAWLSTARLKLLERVSGLCLIGGGIWLLMSRRISST